MQRLADETGGRCFVVSPNQSIESIYAQIEEDLRCQYSFGYTPERKDTGRLYHAIRLATRQPGLFVHTRAGYYAE
jgi:VWFA-related protein